MNIPFGEAWMAYPGSELAELRDANGLMGDATALRQRMSEDGYLLLRGLIDRDKVLRARTTVLQYMAEREAMEPGSRPLEGVMGDQGRSVPLMGRKPITHHPDVRAALEASELFAFYDSYFGKPARPFDYKWLRAVGHEQFTGAHFDVVYMGRGSMNLHTCWIPLGDIPVEMGTLAVCVGSHRLDSFARIRQTYGRMDVDRDRIDGWFTRNPLEVTEKFGGQWCTTSFRAGDVITFGMYTMHASTTNATDRWRLSCDVRFQPTADPTDERWVGDQPGGHGKAADGKPTKPMTEARAEGRR